jgi:hypothetical protein
MTLSEVWFSVTYTRVYEVIAEPPVLAEAGHYRPILNPVLDADTSLRVAGGTGSPPSLNGTESLLGPSVSTWFIPVM